MPAITRSDIHDWVDRLVKEVPRAADVPLSAVFTYSVNRPDSSLKVAAGAGTDTR